MAAHFNIVSVISDAALVVSFITSAVLVGRKIGWYERKIKTMGDTLNKVCRDIDNLDAKRQENEKSSVRYEEKLDGIGKVLGEVKDLLFQHVINGKGNHDT